MMSPQFQTGNILDRMHVCGLARASNRRIKSCLEPHVRARPQARRRKSRFSILLLTGNFATSGTFYLGFGDIVAHFT